MVAAPRRIFQFEGRNAMSSAHIQNSTHKMNCAPNTRPFLWDFLVLTFIFIGAPGGGVCDPTVTTACQSNTCYMLISDDDDCKKAYDEANADCQSRVSALGQYCLQSQHIL